MNAQITSARFRRSRNSSAVTSRRFTRRLRFAM
jgi:hypothetical protein